MRFDFNYFPAYFLLQDMSLAAAAARSNYSQPDTPNVINLIYVDSVDILDLIDQAVEHLKEGLGQQFHKIRLILHFS